MQDPREIEIVGKLLIVKDRASASGGTGFFTVAFDKITAVHCDYHTGHDRAKVKVYVEGLENYKVCLVTNEDADLIQRAYEEFNQ